jgi:hypothetical protein
LETLKKLKKEDNLETEEFSLKTEEVLSNLKSFIKHKNISTISGSEQQQLESAGTVNSIADISDDQQSKKEEIVPIISTTTTDVPTDKTNNTTTIDTNLQEKSTSLSVEENSLNQSVESNNSLHDKSNLEEDKLSKQTNTQESSLTFLKEEETFKDDELSKSSLSHTETSSIIEQQQKEIDPTSIPSAAPTDTVVLINNSEQ